MSLFDQSQVTEVNILQLAGSTQTIGVDTPIVDRVSGVADTIESHGTTMLTNGQAGYSKGATFRLASAPAGVPALYQNVGTTSSSQWVLMETSVASNSTVAYNSNATAGPLTITAALMVDAILDWNGGSADRTGTTDTATAIIGAIPAAVVGSAFQFILRNTSATTGQKITLTGGTGVTISGATSIYANADGTYIGIVTSTSSPAVTLYLIDNSTALLPAVDATTSVNSLQFSTSATTVAPSLTAVGSDTNISVVLAGKGSGAVELGQATSTGVQLLGDQPFVDSSGNTYIAFVKTASAVNGITVTNAATTIAPTLTATGTDTNISFNISPKGTGGMTLGSATGTSDMIFGSSSGAQSVKLANGAGAATVNVANVSTAGNTVNVATEATGAGNTDTINIATGNAAATGIKIVNIATGTPGTSGDNKVQIGGGTTTGITLNGTVTTYQAMNYIASETGSNNAIAGALTDANGNNVTLAAGLRVLVKLAHSLQAGANTFVFNTVSKNITSHRNTGNNIGTAYVSGGIIEMIYDGTQWQDMSQ